jgi:hypothetical protein
MTEERMGTERRQERSGKFVVATEIATWNNV